MLVIARCLELDDMTLRLYVWNFMTYGLWFNFRFWFQYSFKAINLELYQTIENILNKEISETIFIEIQKIWKKSGVVNYVFIKSYKFWIIWDYWKILNRELYWNWVYWKFRKLEICFVVNLPYLQTFDISDSEVLQHHLAWQFKLRFDRQLMDKTKLEDNGSIFPLIVPQTCLSFNWF
jgi:hypothetical protein